MDTDLEGLLRDRFHSLTPAKRRLLELFLSGDDLDGALLEVEEEHIAPRSVTEIELCEIWCEVLGLDTVGVADNFFDLGGDSILSIRIVAKANRLGMPLTSRQLFENPTIAELASLVDAQPRRVPGATEESDAGAVAAPRPDADGWTPDDFPEAELNEEDLQQILLQASRKLTAAGGGGPAEMMAAGAVRVTSEMPRPLVLRSARF